MLIQKVNDRTNFEALFATKEVQNISEFKQAKETLKGFAEYNHIYVNLTEEPDEKGVLTKKFIVKAEDLNNIFERTFKTKKFTSEALINTTKAAIRAMETARTNYHNTYGRGIGEINNAFETISNIFNKGPKK